MGVRGVSPRQFPFQPWKIERKRGCIIKGKNKVKKVYKKPRVIYKKDARKSTVSSVEVVTGRNG